MAWAAYERVDALRAALEASGVGAVRAVETHISWVLLTPTFAYKIKKPVRLGFLDFTELEEDVERAKRSFESIGGSRPTCIWTWSTFVMARRARASAAPARCWTCGAHAQVPRRGPLERAPGRGDAHTVAGRFIRRPSGALHREASVAPPDSPFGSPAVYPALFIPCESDRHARVGTCPVVVRLRVQLS
jgi:hypothetical protein